MGDESTKSESLQPGRIIHGTYEIIRELGHGGGGVVYLVRHTGMDKEMVLKAYSAKIRAKPEMVQREMQIMKDLKHAYIPTIYDFFREEDDVCTVMEYIDGSTLRDVYESKRGVIPIPDVVKWAAQLLEALDYLHQPIHGKEKKGYVHGDIKPQNIMVRENGDICLIDFNVSLALGETDMEIWCSGYASPEHYGYNYSKNPYAGVETAHGRIILPEARSDIYSLGAVLYHIVSRKMPAGDAKDVVPLTEQDGPAPLIQIINRAIRADPDERYQSARDMLRDLAAVRKNDFRSVRLRRQKIVSAAILAGVFILGGVSLFAGQGIRTSIASEKAKISQAIAAVEDIKAQIASRAKESQEAITLSRAALLKGDAEGAQYLSLQALKANKQFVADTRLSLESIDQEYEVNNDEVLFQRDSALQQLQQFEALDSDATYALADALDVYDLSNGFKADQTIELSAAPLKMVLSPSGDSLALLYPWKFVFYDVKEGTPIAEIAAENSALSDVEYLTDSTVVFAGEGNIQAVDLSNLLTLWEGDIATHIAVSGDKNRVAAVYKDEDMATIYDATNGAVVSTIQFQGRKQRVPVNDIYIDNHDSLLSLNDDGSLLAASFSDGTISIFDVDRGEMIEDLLDPTGYSHFEGGFFEDYLVFCASGGGDNPLFAVISMSDPSKDFSRSLPSRFLLQVDERGVYIASGNTLVRFDPETRQQTEVAYTTEKDISSFYCAGDYTVVAASESFAFFDRNANLLSRTDTEYNCDFVRLNGSFAVVGSRDSPTVRVLALLSHDDAEVFSYDPTYAHREARISADGETVMLFKRSEFRLYSMSGELITEAEFPNEEQIYDHQYRRENGESWLEVTYYDGLVRNYSARDGTILSEYQIEPPEANLEEDFFTDALRIHTVPHEAPKAYDRETGEYICDLEKEDGLTYVTQVGDYIITEYISTQGERYGLLLNEQCETLARLPNLCDIVNGYLIFDYPSGNMRRSPIYSVQELISIAEKTTKE